MNKENAHKYLPLVQALADGKIIQVVDRGEWVDVESLYTDVYGPNEYRIKPKSRTFQLWEGAYGNLYPIDSAPYLHWKRITVQEVLK